MEFYTGIPVSTKRFCNPFRRDSDPQCRYEWYENTIQLVDFGSPVFGNVFSIAKHIYPELNQFQLLDKMLEDCNLLSQKGIQAKEVQKTETTETIIKSKIVAFTEEDLKWWKFFTQEELHNAGIYRALRVYINEDVYYNFDRFNPCYVYTFPGTEKVKIYQPLASKERKWRTNINNNFIEGSNTPKIITKSRKDRIILEKAGISNVANVQYEGIPVIPFENFFLLFDSDNTGVTASKKLQETHKCKSIFLPVKDSFEFASLYGLEKLKDYITEQMKL